MRLAGREHAQRASSHVSLASMQLGTLSPLVCSTLTAPTWPRIAPHHVHRRRWCHLPVMEKCRCRSRRSATSSEKRWQQRWRPPWRNLRRRPPQVSVTHCGSAAAERASGTARQYARGRRAVLYSLTPIFRTIIIGFCVLFGLTIIFSDLIDDDDEEEMVCILSRILSLFIRIFTDI